MVLGGVSTKLGEIGGFNGGGAGMERAGAVE